LETLVSFGYSKRDMSGEIFSFQSSTPMSATIPHDSRNRNRNHCITI